MQQVVGLGKEDCLNPVSLLREVHHEVIVDAPYHAGTQPDGIVGLVQNRPMVRKVHTIRRDRHADTIPSRVGTGVVQIEEIVCAVMVVEPGVPHASHDTWFEEHCTAPAGDTILALS